MSGEYSTPSLLRSAVAMIFFDLAARLIRVQVEVIV